MGEETQVVLRVGVAGQKQGHETHLDSRLVDQVTSQFFPTRFLRCFLPFDFSLHLVFPALSPPPSRFFAVRV